MGILQRLKELIDAIASKINELFSLIPKNTSDLVNDGEGNGQYVEDIDLAVVAFSGNYNDLLNQPPPGGGTIFNNYLTIPALLADQVSQIDQEIYFVKNASADPNLDFDPSETKLHAYYRYNGVATNDIDDYTLISAPFAFSQGGGIEIEIKPVPTTTYTLEEADHDKDLYFTHNDGCVVTVPAGLPKNKYRGKQMGDDPVEFEDDGTTVDCSPEFILKTAGKNSVWALDWDATDEYTLYGVLALAVSGSELEIYSESGTLAGGDGVATIGDYDPDFATGSGIYYNQTNKLVTGIGNIFNFTAKNIISIISKGLLTIDGENVLIIARQSVIDFYNASNKALKFDFSNITVNRTLTFQDKSGVAALVSDLVEEKIIGTATYQGITGTTNINLKSFAHRNIRLTGHTDITFTNTPAINESFARTYKVWSNEETFTLGIANSTDEFGSYEIAEMNTLTVLVANTSTLGLTIDVFFSQP